MGAVTFSIDQRLIQMLSKKLPMDVFVETGTFRGETVDLVKSQFREIYSVELSDSYYEAAKQRFSGDPHVQMIHEDSALALRNIMPNIQDRPTLFWLDAHWCVADETAGQLSQCPLLGELEAIQTLNQNSIILIDDARLFLATPQKPHEVSDWPTFHSIIQALFKLSDQHRISVVNDCILFFPQSIEEDVKQFSHLHGVDWLNTMMRSNQYEVSEHERAACLEELYVLKSVLQKSILNRIVFKVLMKGKDKLAAFLNMRARA